MKILGKEFTFNDLDVWHKGNLRIGGRNIVRNSTKFLSGDGGNGIEGSITPEGYLQVVTTSGNGNWHTGWLWDGTGIEDYFNEGDDVVVSFDMKSPNHTSKPHIYLKSGMGYFPMNGKMSTEFSQIWVSTKWSKAYWIAFHFGWSDVVGTTIIKNIQIEKGSVPSCWKPAYEDLLSTGGNGGVKITTGVTAPTSPVSGDYWYKEV